MDSRSGSSVPRLASTVCECGVLSVIVRYPSTKLIRMYIIWLEAVQRDHLLQKRSRSLGAESENLTLFRNSERRGGVYGPQPKPGKHEKAGRFVERARPDNLPALPCKRLYCALAESGANPRSRCA